jgi:ElaB/YqjD/DUF883 family membrane-anchored ribosome-binding protein
MFPQTVKDDSVNKIKRATTAQDEGDDMYSAATQTGRKVRAMIHHASDEVSQAGEKVSTEIHTNPVRSSMIALGLGVVLGALLRRS